MEDHEQGREAFGDEESYRLHCLRHSTAHIMAQAITNLYPEVKLAIGPPIQDGFYYDVAINTTISEGDLNNIEAEMKRICKQNQSFEHEEWSIDEALTFFGDTKQDFKMELIKDLAERGEDTVHVYKNKAKDGSEFVDLCRGPHVMRTKQCKNFRLLKVSGAYWRGDAKREQLQRIYGTVWKKKEELEQYMFRLEEAKKRDHRKLGKELDLFMFHPYAPGAPFWLPKGEYIYQKLSTRMRDLLTSEGYVNVKTPLVFDKKLWDTSGHWEHYQENMFHFQDGESSQANKSDEQELVEDAEQKAQEEERIFGLKPMNCPSHMLIFRSKKRSHKELPLRIHDQGVLHRNELSGALSGLTRVRQFSQDDAHIFCTNDQIGDEVRKLLALIKRIYSAFDMGYAIKLSTRPEKYLGDIEIWNDAEKALEDALQSTGHTYEINAGDGAFYGPKIDFEVLDALGRAFQCATIQLDFQLPIRFKLKYIGSDNEPHDPVVIHRAILGSFERFIGILIEHYAGKFPVWLAPEAIRILTVSEKSEQHGQLVYEALQSIGAQVTFDNSANKIGYKIREARNQRIPYMAIIGEKEMQEGTVSLRSRDEGDIGALSVEDLVARIQEEMKSRL